MNGKAVFCLCQKPAENFSPRIVRVKPRELIAFRSQKRLLGLLRFSKIKCFYLPSLSAVLQNTWQLCTDTIFSISDAMFAVISLKMINCELTLTTHSNSSWFPFSQDEAKPRTANNILQIHNQWRVKPNKIQYFLENIADTTISFFPPWNIKLLSRRQKFIPYCPIKKLNKYI